MFTNWCEQTADVVLQQINKRNTRISLFMATDSEENYCYLLEGVIRLSVEKQYGYGFYYLEIYEDYESFVKNDIKLFKNLDF